MQLKYYTKSSLARYYQKVKEGKWGFPSYKEGCAICGARDCAGFLGFYHRRMVLESWELVKDFPVARYRCTGKGKRRVKAVTFSLLPHAAVPYRLFPLPVMQAIMRFWKELKHTVEGTLDYIMLENAAASKGRTELLVSARVLAGVRQLFDGALEHLGISRHFSTLVLELSGMERQERTIRFLGLIQVYTGVTTELEGIVALDRDYYLLGGGHFRNAHFLFGTPSQFRSPA